MELVIRREICRWNTYFPLGSFYRKNGTTFSGIPFVPENFQWNKPKNRVPFSSQPEFPEFFGKWKTLIKREQIIEVSLITYPKEWSTPAYCDNTSSLKNYVTNNT